MSRTPPSKPSSQTSYPPARRATAYGAFAAVQGAAAALGGAMAGALYEHSLPSLIAAVSAMQLCALILLVITLRRKPDQPARNAR